MVMLIFDRRMEHSKSEQKETKVYNYNTLLHENGANPAKQLKPHQNTRLKSMVSLLRQYKPCKTHKWIILWSLTKR